MGLLTYTHTLTNDQLVGTHNGIIFLIIIYSMVLWPFLFNLCLQTLIYYLVW
jgi:hypothetical protein